MSLKSKHASEIALLEEELESMCHCSRTFDEKESTHYVVAAISRAFSLAQLRLCLCIYLSPLRVLCYTTLCTPYIIQLVNEKD